MDGVVGGDGMGIRVNVRVLLAAGRLARPNGDDVVVELPRGSTITALLQQLGIPETESIVIMKNDDVAGLGDSLNPGDAVVILPPLAGG